MVIQYAIHDFAENFQVFSLKLFYKVWQDFRESGISSLPSGFTKTAQQDSGMKGLPIKFGYRDGTFHKIGYGALAAFKKHIIFGLRLWRSLAVITPT